MLELVEVPGLITALAARAPPTISTASTAAISPSRSVCGRASLRRAPARPLWRWESARANADGSVGVGRYGGWDRGGAWSAAVGRGSTAARGGGGATGRGGDANASRGGATAGPGVGRGDDTGAGDGGAAGGGAAAGGGVAADGDAIAGSSWPGWPRRPASSCAAAADSWRQSPDQRCFGGLISRPKVRGDGERFLRARESNDGDDEPREQDGHRAPDDNRRDQSLVEAVRLPNDQRIDPSRHGRLQ